MYSSSNCDGNSFGEQGHVAETPTEEYFDRLSKENYDRIDDELVKGLNDFAEYEKTPRVFCGLFNALSFMFVGFLLFKLIKLVLDKYI